MNDWFCCRAYFMVAGKEICNDGAITIDIATVKSHPEYKQSNNRAHDIAIMKLVDKVPYNGATKEIGTALTRVCLRHRAIETKMKTFISTLMERLITPLSERADEWRRGCNGSGALSREHARECKRARAELRRRVHDAQRHARKARRATPDVKRRADVCLQDIQERKQQLEEMEEKAVKAALIEERSRFCHFVTLLNPVVESEVAMLAEVGHLQEGTEQLSRQISEPRSLPAGSLQVICDIKSCYSGWAEGGSAPHSPSASRLGSRKSSLTSISSLSSQCSDQHGVSGSTVSCFTPLSSGSSIAPALVDSQRGQSTPRLASVCSSDSGFRSQDALQRPSLYVDNGSDNQSVSSECVTPSKTNDDNESIELTANVASATWPDLKDTAQFERATSAIMGGRPHTISAGTDRGHTRPALSVHTFTENTREGIYARPPLPTVCSESSASESSLESSSGYGSQGAFAGEDHAHLIHPDVNSEIVTLRHSESVVIARENFSISLGSLEEAVRCLDEATECPAFATISKKPAVPKRRPVSMTAPSWSRRGSSSSQGKPPPPVRRSSSISRPRPGLQSAVPSTVNSDVDLPPPPAFLLQPDTENPAHQGINVAETVKQLTELKHMPASPGLLRRTVQNQNENQNPIYGTQNQNPIYGTQNQSPIYGTQNQNPIYGTQNQNQIYGTQNQNLSSFQQAKSNFASSMSLNSTGSLNPIYGQTGNRIMSYVENSVFVRKNSLNSSNSDIYGGNTGIYETKSPHGSTPSTPSYSETNTFSSFGPRVTNESHYGQTGVKLQEREGSIYAAPALVRRLTPRAHSAERHAREHGGLIATLSAKLAPQLSPRSPRRVVNVTESPAKGKGVPATVQPAFLDKLSATLQHQRRMQSRANTVRELINAHAQPDPRVCHTSLMEQIKRGATLKRNKYCNDRSAPKIR